MDDIEEGPDPNDIRRHAKKMLMETEYRKKYRRIDFYRPNRRQLIFHNMLDNERMLRAGNQTGKTHAAAAQMVFDALCWYPAWYTGRKFDKPPKIERPFDFLGWAACTTALKTRDGVQTKLFGDLTQADGLGTGLIPLDNIIGRPSMARGISNFVDTAIMRRDIGARAAIRLKTYEMGRSAFEVEPVDVIWLDEDVKGEQNEGIYGECQARLTTTRGRIMVTMTPVLGLTPIRRRFKQRLAGTNEVLMTIDDALVSNGGHIPDEDVPRLMGQYKTESERQTRLYGADKQGEGAVFETPVSEIKHSKDPATFPGYWPWLWALDFRHSGSASSGHPFAAVLACYDRDENIIYVVHAVRMLGLAVQHVAAIKESPMRAAPVAWPHDGGRGGSIVSGETVAGTYKKLGLNMRPSHATFRDGGFNFEAGIADMEHRFANGKLKISAHLSEVFDEYQGYHRINGLVNKIDDDLLSAIRVLCMDIRFAQTTERFEGYMAKWSNMPMPPAANINFDVFTGEAL